jgi:hypothetical protein
MNTWTGLVSSKQSEFLGSVFTDGHKSLDVDLGTYLAVAVSPLTHTEWEIMELYNLLFNFIQHILVNPAYTYRIKYLVNIPQGSSR